ncbi:type IV inositol polyphosphate 5-phosphatase 6-like [Rhodamnia argentea]|uniref:Type IV inositol polyphosphate 5-phosphatase 6-like n=1 Tax=Rhodamnia argentea TaxID=178133 RepID=A0A8B8P7X5_9MYRT|nr:type IV inositol polyphosphate 5-phosphatase 6-like [Rhodamnia argentea]
MDGMNRGPRSGKGLLKWFLWKHKRDAQFRSGELSDDTDCEDEEDLFELSAQAMEVDACVPRNELRIFVGTWNVAGKSPVGSLAEDLDDWLNLKDAADVYVLGFQEIVPLKPMNVIGGEDPKEAAKWNMLIGKALNERDGCRWLTPMLNPVLDDHYQYAGTSDYEARRSISSSMMIPLQEHPLMKRGKSYTGSKYKLMASKKMVGVFISVWMKKDLLRRYRVSNVRVCSVPCGIMNCLGNKGSVSVSMSVEGTSFCFIAAHLASGEKKGDEGRRNHQVSEIFRRTYFPRFNKDDDKNHPLTILGHDQIFWFGDLNYRLYLENDLPRELIRKQDWRALQQFDQLRKEQEDGVFQGWKEGNIEFAPTYKYSSLNGNRYSGGLPSRRREKQRTPAWCDRILWYGKGARQISYSRSESKFSDHRPVSALFATQIEVAKANPIVAPLPAIFTSTAPSIQLQTGKSAHCENAKSTLMSLIVNDMESLPEATLKL